MIALAAAALAAYGVWRAVQIRSLQTPKRAGSHSAEAQVASDAPVYADDVIAAVSDSAYKVAFGVARFDYQILGEHAAVLQRVHDAVDDAVHRRDFFPRRPLLLPKLLQALKDDESSHRRIAQLVLEDPALAGNVLQTANSAFYRAAPDRIDNIERAVVILGADGMRRLLGVVLLQPVFRLPSGYFNQFADITWEQAQRAANAAHAYAKAEADADPFVAQLLGLVSAMARIVIFRLTMEMYREAPRVLPRAEVFIRAMQRHSARIAHRIAETWELSEASLRALDEQVLQRSPAHMSPLGRAVYYGELCGVLGLLEQRGAYSAEGARALLAAQGASSSAALTMWRAAAVHER